MEEFLKQLREWNDACREARDAFPALLVSEKRDALTADEDTEFRTIAAHVAENDERIAEIELQIAAEARSGQVSVALGAPAVVRSEPLTYERYDPTQSYFRDLALGMVQNDAEAMGRLQRHGQEMDKIIPQREARRAERAEREIRSVIGNDAPSPFEQRVNPNRTDGQGGYFVPPLWLVDEYATALRAGRPFANALRNIPLPAGTDSINVPAISTGTTAAAQTADGASVSSTDLTDTSISAPVRTIAGQQDVSLQLIEQSPISFDEVVFTDLVADYNKKLDAQLWTGSGSSGQLTGVDNISSTNSTTYTDASPTVPEFWVPLAQATSLLAQNRFDFSSTRFWFHPRRWFWMLGALDTTNRPLIVPSSVGFNPMAQPELAAQGHVGVLSLGLPASIDANISTSQTDGATGEDRAYAINTNDLLLFEGSMRTRALPEVLSGTLQVRLQVYNYVAFLVRYAKAISWIKGTGQAAPAGY